MTETTQRPQNIPSLTPLRGIAAMMVAVLHFSDEWLPSLNTTEFTMLIQRGYLWVDFFFVLSGFIITHVYGTWFTSSFDLNRFGRFMYIRFAKIYPVHIVVLCGFLSLEIVKLVASVATNIELVSAPFDRETSLFALFTSVLLIHSLGLHDFAVWNLPSWSMSVEWYAYVIFPVIALAVLRRAANWTVPMGIALLVLVFLLGSYRGNLNLINDYGYFRCVLEFTLGMIVYRMYAQGILAELARRDSTFVAAAAVALTVMHFGWFDAFVVPAFALAILSAAQNRGLVHRVLNTRPLIFLGDISYSLYMSHFLLLIFLGRAWKAVFGFPFWELGLDRATSVAVLAFNLCLVVLVAWLVYRLIERPAQRALRQGKLARRDVQEPMPSKTGTL